MTKRKAPAASGPAPPARTQRSASIEVLASSQDDMNAAVARTLMRPEVGAASTIELWQKDTHDVNALAAELAGQVQAVNGGDLRRAEGMLISQAHTLNDLFNILLRRVTTQTMLPQWEAYMRAAMKAQSQCRMTLEALAEMKSPKAVAFVRQANFANGPQQVNNGPTTTHTGARAENSQPPIKQLEQQHGEWLDTGASGTTSGADPHLEAVGAVDRTSKRRR